jgi:phospholipase/carboxylesterase
MQLTGPIFQPKSGKVKKIIVFLHGVGANGDDLISLAPVFAPVFPDTLFISPNAPQAYDMAPFGYQWFSLQNRTPENMLNGAKAASEKLNPFLDELLAEHKLTDADLALIGFSQGTMTALYTALRRKHACAGVIGYSGALIGADIPPHPFTSKPPICLIHGEDDNVVPFSAMQHAARILERAEIQFEAHPRPGLGHGIDEEGLEIAAHFLKHAFKQPHNCG